MTFSMHFEGYGGHVSGELGESKTIGQEEYKKVSSGIIKVGDYEKNLYSLVAPGWDICFNRTGFNTDPNSKNVILGLEGKEYCDISHVLSAYHECGHSHDFDPFLGQGDINHIYFKAGSPTLDVSYYDMKVVMYFETSAWAFALKNVAEFESDKKKLAEYKKHARNCIQSYYKGLSQKPGNALIWVALKDGVERFDLERDFHNYCATIDREMLGEL